ncbi:hypothetical protein ACGF8A_03695, partial [Streptomyces sp. NPDC047706]
AGSFKNSHHRRSQGSSSFPKKLSTDVSRWIRAEVKAAEEPQPTAKKAAAKPAAKPAARATGTKAPARRTPAKKAEAAAK